MALHARFNSVESIDLENSVCPIPTIAVLSFSINIYLGKFNSNRSVIALKIFMVSGKLLL